MPLHYFISIGFCWDEDLDINLIKTPHVIIMFIRQFSMSKQWYFCGRAFYFLFYYHPWNAEKDTFNFMIMKQFLWYKIAIYCLLYKNLFPDLDIYFNNESVWLDRSGVQLHFHMIASLSAKNVKFMSLNQFSFYLDFFFLE